MISLHVTDHQMPSFYGELILQHNSRVGSLSRGKVWYSLCVAGGSLPGPVCSPPAQGWHLSTEC